MNMTKREFFKRKNKVIAYEVYTDTVHHAYEVADEYYMSLLELIDKKDKYRTNTHIWELLNQLYNEVTVYHITNSYYRCIMSKETPYKVRFNEYGIMYKDIQKLVECLGKIEATFNVINYLEENELGIRSV